MDLFSDDNFKFRLRYSSVGILLSRIRPLIPPVLADYELTDEVVGCWKFMLTFTVQTVSQQFDPVLAVLA